MTKPKLCKDCKWYEKINHGILINEEICKLEINSEYYYINSMRKIDFRLIDDDTLCGPEGKYWEEK